MLLLEQQLVLLPERLPFLLQLLHPLAAVNHTLLVRRLPLLLLLLLLHHRLHIRNRVHLVGLHLLVLL